MLTKPRWAETEAAPRRLLAAFLVVCIFAVSADATLVVVQWTPTEIILAVDGLAMKVQGNEVRGVPECKIHQEGDIFFTIVGLNSDPSVNVDLVAVARRAIRGAGGELNEALTSFSEKAKPAIRRLARGRGFRAASLASLSVNRTTIILASRREHILALKAFEIRPNGSVAEKPADIRGAGAPSDSAMDVSVMGVYAEANAALERNPSIKQLDTVNLSIWFIQTQRNHERKRLRNGQPARVGLPISVLRIRNGSASWVSQFQGACAQVVP